MNRNDLVVPSTGEAAKPAVVSPRPTSPRKTPSPRKQKLGLGAFKKGALLEEQSVHLSLPSFHDKNHRHGGWKCAGCSYENLSALSNDCSVCGMIRNLSFHRSLDEHEDISESMDGSFGSLCFDGDRSENSLSLNHCFSIKEHREPREDEFIGRAHASLPVSFQNSFSGISVGSTRTTRTAHRNHRSRRSNSSRQGDLQDFDEESSVMSFCNWNGNEKVKPWECAACTYVNENPLHLTCEMCGSRRNIPNTTAQRASIIEDDGSCNDNDEELDLIREEQIRELIDIQREIMADFGVRPTTTSAESRFNTQDLQREIANVSASIPTRTSRLDYNDVDCLGSPIGEQERLKELLAAQKEIMMDFKRKRTTPEDYDDHMDKKPAGVTKLTPTPGRNFVPADTLFGCNEPNTTPSVSSAGTSLKESMKAAGGKLRHEDLCLPLLWGDSFGSLEKAGTKASAKSQS